MVKTDSLLQIGCGFKFVTIPTAHCCRDYKQANIFCLADIVSMLLLMCFLIAMLWSRIYICTFTGSKFLLLYTWPDPHIYTASLALVAALLFFFAALLMFCSIFLQQTEIPQMLRETVSSNLIAEISPQTNICAKPWAQVAFRENQNDTV